MTQILCADIKSRSGQISFDVNSDSHSELQLNQTGLGVGIQPESKLHVQGNAIVTNQLSIGSYSGSSSNLHVNGTFGFGLQTLSSNVTLDDTSMILVKDLSDHITLTLPYAGNLIGRSYQIKMLDPTYKAWVRGGGSLIDDVGLLELSHLSSVKLMSNGAQWYILESTQLGLTVASENLRAWWKFDETSGGTVFDSGPSGIVGTLEAGLSFSTAGNTAGQINHSLDLDGVDDYVDFGSTGGDLIEGDGFSVSCWFKINDALVNLDGIISKDTSSPFAYSLRFNASSNLQYMMNNNALNSDFSPTIGQWYHVVSNFDTTNGRSLWINGVSIADDAYVTPATSNGDALFIGFDHNIANTRHPAMSIDDVKIFDRPLTEEEIGLIYNSGLSP